jgi:hypothetical protein
MGMDRTYAVQDILRSFDMFYSADELYDDSVTSPLARPQAARSPLPNPLARIPTDDDVRAAIAVLKAYADGELSLDNDILDELEQAIEAAFNSSLPDQAEDYDQTY